MLSETVERKPEINYAHCDLVETPAYRNLHHLSPNITRDLGIGCYDLENSHCHTAIRIPSVGAVIGHHVRDILQALLPC